eukprot:c6728_g1_i1.p1 GENE.c6728_g1_i1~~c6728_g1_i1.p1  ORF type:complete len:146 (+),score=20.81 c6728_g1_i1:24-461(+)
MFSQTRTLLGGLSKYKFIGPRWSQTRRRNLVGRMKQERSVIDCLRQGKTEEEACETGARKHPGYLYIQLKRSIIARSPDQIKSLQVLNLRKINAVVERPNTVAVRAVVNKVRHLVLCQHADERVKDQEKPKPRYQIIPRVPVAQP